MRELERLKTSMNHHQWPPIGAPMNLRREEPCKSRFDDDDDSVNAVSFGFVATAIIISMFLVMAIFEKLIRKYPDSSSGRILSGIDSRVGFNSAASKLGYHSPKTTVYTNGVSVLMPGDDIPTFIAHPVPTPRHPQHVSQSQHQHSSSRDSSSSNSIQEC